MKIHCFHFIQIDIFHVSTHKEGIFYSFSIRLFFNYVKGKFSSRFFGLCKSLFTTVLHSFFFRGKFMKILWFFITRKYQGNMLFSLSYFIVRKTKFIPWRLNLIQFFYWIFVRFIKQIWFLGRNCCWVMGHMARLSSDFGFY